jgi:hypothetical protein
MIVAMILGDWPENGKYCLTYGGSKCKNPCHNCLVDRNNLNKINLTTEEMLPRTQQNMQTAINSGLTKEHSIHEQNNAFWNLPYVFLINVFDNIIKYFTDILFKEF